MKFNSYLLLVLVIIISCEKGKVKKEFYEDGTLKKEYALVKEKINGELKEYDKKGNLLLLENYKNNVKVDSSIQFNEVNKIIKIEYFNPNSDTTFVKKYGNDGKLDSKGSMFNGFKIEKWFTYRNSKIRRINEYFIINNEQYNNQGWVLNIQGDTIINKGSNFMELKYPKSVFVNEEFQLRYFLTAPLFINSKVKLFIDLDYYPGVKINSDFSNLDSIDFTEIGHHPKDNYFTGSYLKYVIKGDKNLKGYLLEYYDKIPTKKDSIRRQERRIYFDFSINVKDSLAGNESATTHQVKPREKDSPLAHE